MGDDTGRSCKEGHQRIDHKINFLLTDAIKIPDYRLISNAGLEIIVY